MTRKLFAALMATIAFASTAVAETLPSISDETGPAICPAGKAVTDLRCSGRYCDNIQATCTRYVRPPSAASSQPSYWTPWFSEEKNGDVIDGSNFPKLADTYSIVIGLQCKGSYCDDMRLLMLPLRGPGVPTLDSKVDAPICRTSPSFSEENGGWGPRRMSGPLSKWLEFMHRIGCSGSYCDNLRVEWCRVFYNQ